LTEHLASSADPAGTPVPQEVEAALVVTAQAPHAVLEEIAARSSLGDFSLCPRPDRQIHDTYYDTPDSVLGARCFSLRLRRVAGRVLVTLKGAAASADAALKTRQEMEAEWSAATLHSVLAALARHAIHLPPPSSLDDPSQSLAALGLCVIQERHTHRRPREVSRGVGTPVLAEMALDAVTFHLPGQEVRHCEIEVEAAHGATPADIKEISLALREAYPGCLQPWPFAKLALGFALLRLQQEGCLNALLTPQGTLRPVAYRLLRLG